MSYQSIVIVMTTMSMWLDYVSGLGPQTGLLFNAYVILEHGEPWWNNIDRG
jgi:hypothetical protein